MLMSLLQYEPFYLLALLRLAKTYPVLLEMILLLVNSFLLAMVMILLALQLQIRHR
jgi:hypothetical protein